MDSPMRSLTKAVCWRIGGFAFMWVVAWLVTKDMRSAATISMIDAVAKIGLYYAHERAWERINFGRQPAEYEI